MNKDCMYISKYQALKIHEQLISDYGGETGILDEEKLISCLFQPTTSFYGHEQYPTLEEKSAVYLYSVVMFHPFMDGNKRAGYTYTVYFLKSLGASIEATSNEKITFVMDLASNKKSLEQVIDWIKKYSSINHISNDLNNSESLQNYILHSTEILDWDIYNEIKSIDDVVLKKLAE